MVAKSTETFLRNATTFQIFYKFHHWAIPLNLQCIWKVSHNVGNTTKGRISKRVSQKNKALSIFRKTNTSYPLIRTRKWSKKCLFFGKCGMLCFLVTPVLRFVLSAYYRRYNLTIWPCSLILLCLKHSRKNFCSQFALPETGDWGKEVDRRENYLWISESRRGFCGQLFSYYFTHH